MTRDFVRFALCFSLCFGFLPASSGENAAKKKEAPKPTDFLSASEDAHGWFGYFEVSAVGAFRLDDGGYVIAPHLSWKPTWSLGPDFALRAVLAASVFKSQAGTSATFPVYEYQLALACGLDSAVLEVGGGAQTWPNNGDTMPMASLGFGFPIPEDWLGIVDRVVIGYALLFSSPRLTNEVKLGLGLAF